MNDIERFVECQKLWQQYESIEKQVEVVGNYLDNTVVARFTKGVMQGLYLCEEAILGEIRQHGWYDDDDLAEFDEPVIDWEEVFEQAEGEY